jgi:hypothetical protein
MHVIGTYQLHAVLLGIFYQFGIGYLLQFVRFMVSPCHSRLVALQFQIEIITKLWTLRRTL